MKENTMTMQILIKIHDEKNTMTMQILMNTYDDTMTMLMNTYDEIYHDNANERTDPKTTCQDTGHNRYQTRDKYFGQRNRIFARQMNSKGYKLTSNEYESG